MVGKKDHIPIIVKNGVPFMLVILLLCQWFVLHISIGINIMFPCIHPCLLAVLYIIGVDEKHGTEVYPNIAASLTALGVSFGGEYLFGAFEVGILCDYPYTTQVGSRLLSFSIGYRI